MTPLFVFVAVFAVTEGSLVASGAGNHPPRDEEARIAEHLALGHGFRSPMSTAGDAPATGWSPPVYPMLMAGVFKIFGEQAKSTFFVLGAFNCFAFAAAATAAFLLLGGKEAGGLAAALFCLHPLLRGFVSHYWDETAALALYFAALVLASRVTRTRGAVLLGAVLGVLSLTSAGYVFSYPLLVLKAGRRAILPASVAFVLVMLPWTLRLHHEFGGLRYVRTGPQVELWIGNQPVANGWISASMLTVHPYRNAAEGKLILEMGEPAYFERAGEAFRSEISPGSFAARSLRRFVFLFLSDPSEQSRIGRTVLNALVTLLGLAGFAAMARLGFKSVWLLPAGLLSVAPYLITSASDRYALPLRATLTLGVAFLIWALTHRQRYKAWPASNL